MLSQLWNLKEPNIIAKGICDYFLYKHLPEKTVQDRSHKLIEFAYVVKKLSYDYVALEQYDENGNSCGFEVLQNINRAFIQRYDGTLNLLVKHGRNKDGTEKTSSVTGLKDKNCLVWNGEMLSEESIDEISSKIDYDAYIARIYERIKEFVNIRQLKEIR